MSKPYVCPANRRLPAAAGFACLLGLAPFAYASSPALTQQQLQAGVDSYINQFPALLAQTGAQLPANAMKASGKALVALTLAADGRVLGTKISQTSGNQAIDNFALDDIGSAHYPPFNAEMPYKSFVFTVPITVMPPPPSTQGYAPATETPWSTGP